MTDLIVTEWSENPLFVILFVLVAYGLALWPSGWVVGRVTQRWRERLEQEGLKQGLQGAGKIIGFLERFIIVTLVLLAEYDAIAFLIAAKSLLRFGELQGNQDKVQTEYVLVGTLMSITLAMLIGLLANFCLLLLATS